MNSKQLTDKQWLDEMIIELRLRDVRGTTIGDAVASVQEFCRDTGSSPHEAFGSPQAYAHSLSFPAGQVDRPTLLTWARIFLPIVMACGSLALVPKAVSALRHHEQLAVSWGLLLSGGVLLAAMGLLVLCLRQITERPRVLGLAFAAVIVVVTGLPLLLDQRAFSVGPVTGLILGVTVLIGCLIAMLTDDVFENDPMVDPRDGQADDTMPTWLSRWIKFTPWEFPIAAALLSALAWFVG